MSILKKILFLALSLIATNAYCFTTVDSNNNVITLDTGNSNITCTLKQFSPMETRKFFFNDQAARTMTTAAKYVGHELKDMHRAFRPFNVIIKNNTNKAIKINRSSYLKGLDQHRLSPKDLHKLYPNFKKLKASWLCGTICTGLIAVSSLIAQKTADSVGERLFYAYLFVTALACSIWGGTIVSKASTSVLLQNIQKDRLLPRVPGKQCSFRLKNVRIEPGESFREIIILDTDNLSAQKDLIMASTMTNSLALNYYE